MAGSFLKCGYLKIKRPPTSGKVRIKAWQSKYFVLRDIPPIFEYFKDEFSFHNARHTKEKNKINLDNVIHIGTTDASKTQRNAFMIVDAKKGAIMLAADSEKETKEWIDVLNKVSGKYGSTVSSIGEVMDNDSELPPLPRSTTSSIGSPTLEELGSPVSISDTVQGFPVTTRLTPSSEKLGIRDDYTMYITDEFVAVHELETCKLVVQWPIIGLRGWKSEPADVAGRRGTQLLTLEAGRKSATGEGLFQFFSDFGNHIANIIRVRSSVLAVENLDVFKDRDTSCVSEEPSPDLNNKRSIKANPFPRSATDPRPVVSLVVAQKQLSLPARSESDSNIFDKGFQRRTASPPSLRKDVLHDNLTKDILQSLTGNSPSPNEGQDNAYLHLINDKDATPVHIADEDHRKSLDSLSLNSEDGVIMQRSLLNTVSEINNSKTYIDDSEISTSYKKKQLRKRRSLEDRNDNVLYSDPTKLKGLDSQAKKKQQSSSNALCKDFMNQISNPISHQENIFQEKSKTFPSREQLVKAKHEKVESSVLVGKSKQASIDVTSAEKPKQTNADGLVTEKAKQESIDGNMAPKSNDTGLVEKSMELSTDNGNDFCQNINNNNTLKKQSEFDATSSTHEEPSLHKCDQTEHEEEDEGLTMRKPPTSNSTQRAFPQGKEETMDLLEKMLNNLESPQTCAQGRIFPPKSRRDGNDKLEKTKSDTTASMSRHEALPKKTIEKSKSHIGFDIKQQTEKPPPLPTRPEISSHARTKPSASLGDISKDLPRPLDFHKDIHRQLPWSSNAPTLGAPCGPESLVHARLLHRSTSGSSLVALKEAHQLTNHDIEKTTAPTFDGSSRAARGSVDFPVFNQENDRVGDDDFDKKRRGSKATMLLSRMLHTFNPSESKRRGSCDVVTNGGTRDCDLTRKGRSSSLINTGIVNEGWSPEQSLDVPSPEGSPLNFRRSIPANRRLSHDPNMDRNRKIFIGSPTFDSARSKEEMRQREKAKERERERSELPNEPPPQLPPRKKSDPPPLPPRIRKSSSDSSGPSSPKSKLQPNETMNSVACDDDVAPPPIPPRRVDDRRGSQPAPLIHLTMSSPEEKPLNHSLRHFSGGETADTTTAGASTTPQPNNATTETSENNAMPHPIPQRPKATHGEITSHHAPLNTLPETTEVREQVSETQTIKEHSFVSIEMQERSETDLSSCTLEERLEIREIERDSIGSSPQPNNTSAKNGHTALNLQSSIGSSERHSPGHTPPMGLNLSPRSGGIVLGDSPTTPISV